MTPREGTRTRGAHLPHQVGEEAPPLEVLDQVERQHLLGLTPTADGVEVEVQLDAVVGDGRASSSVNRTALRKALVKGFTIDELALLCDDVRATIADDGVELDLDLDTIGGRNQPEEVLALNLFQHLERRGFLAYLVRQVRSTRPGSLPEGS